MKSENPKKKSGIEQLENLRTRKPKVIIGTLGRSELQRRRSKRGERGEMEEPSFFFFFSLSGRDPGPSSGVYSLTLGEGPRLPGGPGRGSREGRGKV